MPTAVTLFAGIGSSSLAARNTGHRVVAAVEKWPVAVDTLRRNLLPGVQADVKELTFLELWPNIDLLIGGPPCQPFSQGTIGTGQYDERDCIPDFIRAVTNLQPGLFIMEEVQTLTWKKHSAYFQRVLADLKAAGYTVDYRVLDCSKHGVAQARKRLFVIGRRGDAPVSWPEELPQRSMASALGWDTTMAARRNAMAPTPALDPVKAQWVYSRPSTTVVGSFRPEVQAAPAYRRAGDGPRQNAPGSVVITEREALILQGLPPDWKIAGRESERRLQIGNSVPTVVLERLIEANQ